jgi:adenosylcobinamide amidohydrolase
MPQGPELERRRQGADGAGAPVLVWRFPASVRAIATTVLGGGVGDRRWVLNAEVPREYHVADPGAHAAAIGSEQRLDPGAGIGLLTAAPVFDVTTHCDGGARCDATVGISRPTWAAAADGSSSEWRPGTINLVCWVPAPLGDAALANALATATEAKVQALVEASVPGTGTATDAVAVCCPIGGTEPYGGPRSRWGARLARAVHGAVQAGLAQRTASP